MKMSTLATTGGELTTIEGTFSDLLKAAKTGSIIELGTRKLSQGENLLLGGRYIVFKKRNLFTKLVEDQRVSLGSHPTSGECKDGPLGVVFRRRNKLYWINPAGSEELIYSGPLADFKVGTSCVVASYAEQFMQIRTDGSVLRIPGVHEFWEWGIASESDQVVLQREKKFMLLKEDGAEVEIGEYNVATVLCARMTRWGMGLLHKASFSSLDTDGSKVDFGLIKRPGGIPLFGRFGFVDIHLHLHRRDYLHRDDDYFLIRPGGVEVSLGSHRSSFCGLWEHGLVFYEKSGRLYLVVVKEEERSE